MKSAVLWIVAGLSFVLVGVLWAASPVTSIINHFGRVGIKTKAKVVGRSIHTKSVRKGKKFKRTRSFSLQVSFAGASKALKMPESFLRGIKKAGLKLPASRPSGGHATETIRKFLTHKEFEQAKKGRLISIVYLKGKDRREGYPNVLLQSTMERSFLTHLRVVLRDHLIESASGLMVVVFGFVGVFLGVLRIFRSGRS